MEENYYGEFVDCSIPHTPKCVGICINGHLYYKAMGNEYQLMIVRFDIRSEKFKFTTINNYEAVQIQFLLRTLIDYKVKLGALITDLDGMFSRATTCIEFWVLDDVEEHKWWRHYIPPLWESLVENYWLVIVRMTRNGEIVLTSLELYDPFYTFCYNMKRKTITRIKIQGMEGFKGRNIFTFTDHIEDVRLMEAIMATKAG